MHSPQRKTGSVDRTRGRAPGAGTATCMSKYCSRMRDACGAFPWYFGQHGPVFFVTPPVYSLPRSSLLPGFFPSFQLRLPHHCIATACGGSPGREPRTNPLQRNESAVGFRRQSFTAAERTNALVCRARLSRVAKPRQLPLYLSRPPLTAGHSLARVTASTRFGSCWAGSDFSSGALLLSSSRSFFVDFFDIKIGIGVF